MTGRFGWSKYCFQYIEDRPKRGDAAMVLLVLFLIFMTLWFLTNLPVPPVNQYPWASNWLGFLAVLTLGLYVLVPGLR